MSSDQDKRINTKIIHDYKEYFKGKEKVNGFRDEEIHVKNRKKFINAKIGDDLHLVYVQNTR